VPLTRRHNENIDLIRECSDCVSTSVANLKKTDAHVMSIRCTTDEPIVYRPYRMAESEKSIENYY